MKNLRSLQISDSRSDLTSVFNELDSVRANEPTIKCPSCNTEIKLTESLAAPLLEAARQQFDQRIAEKELDIGKREAGLLEAQRALAKERENVSVLVNEKLKAEREKIAFEEGRKARMLLADELQEKSSELIDLQEALRQRDEKLTHAQNAQIELLRKQRELADAIREQEFTIETRVQDRIVEIREQSKAAAERELSLKILQKDHIIETMQKQIDELRRTGEQGLEQLQGEMQELLLESVLRRAFPRDTVEPVPRGEYGADVMHRVFDASGQVCGNILLESKRTKTWSDAWLSKLREDLRRANADIAIIVSQAVPKQIDTFGFFGGVFITKPQYVVPLVIVLRQSLIEIASLRVFNEGHGAKMEMIHQYVNGPCFRHRVEAIAERVTDMQLDLDRERKSTNKQWAKRQQQINGIGQAAAGLYGDVQGIIGKTLQEIDGLYVEPSDPREYPQDDTFA